MALPIEAQSGRCHGDHPYQLLEHRDGERLLRQPAARLLRDEALPLEQSPEPEEARSGAGTGGKQ